eukprot:8697807-Pyramimonas_sp.AAC.1
MGTPPPRNRPAGDAADAGLRLSAAATHPGAPGWEGLLLEAAHLRAAAPSERGRLPALFRMKAH